MPYQRKYKYINAPSFVEKVREALKHENKVRIENFGWITMFESKHPTIGKYRSLRLRADREFRDSVAN